MINMLQIILFILKAIGILLVSVLGILLVLISILLLIPIRYCVQAEKYEDVAIRVKVGWFFRILYLKMIYEKEKLSYQVRIFGFLFQDSNKPKKKRMRKKRKKARKQGKEKVADIQIDSNINKVQENEIPKEIKVAEELKEIETVAKTDTPKRKQTFFSNMKNKIKSVQTRIKAIPGKFKTFIFNLQNRISLLIDFLQDEINQQGIKKIFGSVKSLVKHILPEKLCADLRFGTGDPCSTGQVLAIISLTYHLYEKSVRIIPDFEESVIEGNVFIKGRIRLGTLLIITIKLLLNKNFKQLQKNFYKLKEEL